jgi:hypothetical protein
MNWKIVNQRILLNLFGAIILVVGLSSAVLIYQRAGNAPYGALGYEIVDGTLYPIMPEDSKMYRHNLEVYGGKLMVMIDDCRRWFIGLWHGKPLAVIIGFTTIIISSGLFFTANKSSRPLQSELHNDSNPDGTC